MPKHAKNKVYAVLHIEKFPVQLREDMKAIARLKDYRSNNMGVFSNRFIVDVLQLYVDRFKKKRGGLLKPPIPTPKDDEAKT